MLFVGRDDLLETWPSTLHVLQAIEHICQNRVPSARSHVHQVHILDRTAIHESPWWEYLKSVVIHINMHFTTKFQIVAMNKGVYQTLFHSTLRIFRIFKTIVGRLTPSLLWITTHEVHTSLQECHQTATVFLIVQSIHHTICLVHAIPAGAEQTRVAHWRIVGKESTSISQFALLVDDAERFVVAILKRAVGTFEVSSTQHCKCHVLKSPARHLTVIRHIAALQHQFLVFRHACHHALVTYTHKSLHLTITNVIVRSLSTRHYIEYYKLLVLALGERKLEVWYRVDVTLDSFADFLRITFCISKTNQRIVIRDTPHEFTTNAIGKGTHALAPTLRFLHLQSLFLIVFCCFAY